jgi:hypothetical protein
MQTLSSNINLAAIINETKVGMYLGEEIFKAEN